LGFGIWDFQTEDSSEKQADPAMARSSISGLILRFAQAQPLL